MDVIMNNMQKEIVKTVKNSINRFLDDTLESNLTKISSIVTVVGVTAGVLCRKHHVPTIVNVFFFQR